MDERDVRRKRDAVERRAQHRLTHRAVPAVDVLHGEVDAVFRALEAHYLAQSEPEWRGARARRLHPLNERSLIGASSG